MQYLTTFLLRTRLASLALLLCAGCASSPRPAEVKTEAQSGSAVATTAGTSEASADSPSRKAQRKKSVLSSKLAKSFDDAVARGDSAWKGGDVQMAIYMYVQALSFQPRDFNTLCKLGAIEEKRDEPELAIRAYELAAETKPDDSLITGHLGLLYLQQSDEDKALGWLDRSAASGSDDWRVFDGLGVAEGHHGQIAAGLQHLQQAVALAPQEPMPALHRGQLLFDSGDYPAAETTLRAATERGSVPQALSLLGQIQAKHRQYPEAIDSMLRAVDPPIAYDTVAKLAMQNGDNATAVKYFELAARMSPIYYADAHRDAALAQQRLNAAR
jgi:tetratricopeptide (TPR) repeat protein